MSKCFILRIPDSRDDESEELRFAGMLLETEIRKVFDGLVTLDSSDKFPPINKEDCVLVAGDPAFFLSSESLLRMKERVLEDGAGIVYSIPVECFADFPASDIRTLRGFRRFERRILQDGGPDAPTLTSQLRRVPLFSGEVFQELLGAERTVGEIWSDWRSMADGVQADWAGVHLAFADYYGSARDDILPFIPPGVSRILDVGCASGETGKLLKESLQCHVSGVEPHPLVAAMAREKLDEVHVGSLQDLDIEEKFDVVIAADVIEHQVDFGDFLRRLASLAVEGGRVVLSIPNVGHHSIVEDLLAGRWDYVPIGLLCVTHVRFFTRATLGDWLELNGFPDFEIHHQAPTELPKEFGELSRLIPTDEENLRTPGFYVVVHVHESTNSKH